MILRRREEGCEVRLRLTLKLYLLTAFMAVALLLSGCAAETIAPQDVYIYDVQYQEALRMISETRYDEAFCQLALDFPEHQFALFLVNAYWNVREVNIDYYGIPPHQKASTPEAYEAALDRILLSTS